MTDLARLKLAFHEAVLPLLGDPGPFQEVAAADSAEAAGAAAGYSLVKLAVRGRVADAVAVAEVMGRLPDWMSPQIMGRVFDALFRNISGNTQAARYDRAKLLLRVAEAIKTENAAISVQIANMYFRIGEYDLAEPHWGRHVRLKDEALQRHPLARTGLRIFQPSWMITRIGEIAQQLDLHVKAMRLGWIPQMHCVLLAPLEQVVNHALLDYWREHVPIVTDKALIERMNGFAGALPYDPVYVPGRDGRHLHKANTHRLVQQDWEKAGHGPLLKLKHEHYEKGWAQLRRQGMAEGDWFVCLHVREAGYLSGEAKDPSHYHRFRNAEIATYMDAVRHITAQGGWVVRVGDPSMTPFPVMDRVIDYARSDFRSDWMDLFLCSQNRFFLGTSSGLFVVAMTFGAPVILSNMTPLSQSSNAGSDLFIPKLYRDRQSGRTLSFEESLKAPLKDNFFGDTFHNLGFEVIDNEPEDILAAVREMMARLDGRPDYTEEDEARNAALEALFERTGNIYTGRISRDFLRRHANLL